MNVLSEVKWQCHGLLINPQLDSCARLMNQLNKPTYVKTHRDTRHNSFDFQLWLRRLLKPPNVTQRVTAIELDVDKESVRPTVTT
jgi:hypothetical protein